MRGKSKEAFIYKKARGKMRKGKGSIIKNQREKKNNNQEIQKVVSYWL